MSKNLSKKKREEQKSPHYPEKEKSLSPRKTSKPPKIFYIECRFKSIYNLQHGHFPEWTKWGVWKKYETVEQAEKAFKDLKKSHKRWTFMEFRIPPITPPSDVPPETEK